MKTVEQRFWDRVDKSGHCWLYRGYCLPNGYGRFQINGTPDGYAHRASYVFAFGAIPTGMDVLHRCDVPNCVNPTHLFVGTAKDNVRDMLIKDRQRIKLAWWDVAHIRAMLNKGYFVMRIAKMFGIHRRTVWAIKSGLIWSREKRMA